MNRIARRLKLAFYDLIPYPSKKRIPDQKVKKSDTKPLTQKDIWKKNGKRQL